MSLFGLINVKAVEVDAREVRCSHGRVAHSSAAMLPLTSLTGRVGQRKPPYDPDLDKSGESGCVGPRC
jgi:hypothetical protein